MIEQTITNARAMVTVRSARQRNGFGMFVVTAEATSGRGRRFEAILPACGCSRRACTRTHSHDDWTVRHSGEFCHGEYGGRHPEHVDVFAAAVLRTYGERHRPRMPQRPQARIGSWAPERVAEALGLTVERYRAELARAAS